MHIQKGSLPTCLQRMNEVVSCQNRYLDCLADSEEVLKALGGGFGIGGYHKGIGAHGDVLLGQAH